jgi:hypothetical protein
MLSPQNAGIASVIVCAKNPQIVNTQNVIIFDFLSIFLRRLLQYSLFFAKVQITVALLNFVVAQKHSEDKIFLGRVLVKRLVANVFDDLDALFRAEKNVDFFSRNLTCEVVDARHFEPSFRLKPEFRWQSMKYQFSEAFFVFVDVMCKNFHFVQPLID